MSSKLVDEFLLILLDNSGEIYWTDKILFKRFDLYCLITKQEHLVKEEDYEYLVKTYKQKYRECINESDDYPNNRRRVHLKP